MIVVKVKTGAAADGETVRYVAESIGAALDTHAPDPSPGAYFEVTVGNSVRVTGGLRPVGTTESEDHQAAVIVEDILRHLSQVRSLSLPDDLRSSLVQIVESSL